MTLKTAFWIFLGIILYAYIGYTIVLAILSTFRALFRLPVKKSKEVYEPAVTMLIPAYNEEQFVIEKVNNTLELYYPKEKLKVIWITDGSTDDTRELLYRYPEMQIMHERERRGKIHAMNRGMQVVTTPLVIFTDANSMLNAQAIREIIKPFMNPKTGCVSGEKRIGGKMKQMAVGAGEGLYWQYESLIKRLESETGSVVGAVGEIFAIRTGLYEAIREDTLLDDFTLSLRMVQKGYTIKYAPDAWGTETASLSIEDEIVRKIRIAIGGLQILTRMTDLLNPFKYGLLSFKYFSHKVMRWILVPFSFPIVFLLNFIILLTPYNSLLYTLLFAGQCAFYMLAFAGSLLKRVRTRFRVMFAPYYLCIMNLAVINGFFRFITGKYSVKWQKVKRT